MEKISRTKRKQAAQLMQKMGERLVALDNAQFEALELPDELLKAIAMARRIKKKEARRRQLQYIGKLMRQYDSGAIQKAVESVTAEAVENLRRFKLAERWRDELVAGSPERFAWLVENVPNISREKLKLLVEKASHLHTGENTRKAGRELFRYLIQRVEFV
jgi:ribosome-associated protein